MDRKFYAERLQEARINAGYTQIQIKDILKISQGTIASYETGRTQPDLDTLRKLADLYEISVDWLLGTKINYDKKNKPS